MVYAQAGEMDHKMPPLRKVSPILKPVAARCNLRCRYCYYKRSHDTPDRGRIMGDRVLSRIVDEVIEIAARIGSKAEFTWHGGEPTLAGLDFFRQVVELQYARREASGHQDLQIVNSIQTNATLISEDWCELLKEHDVSLGVSLDGPGWLHNLNRTYASGRGSFEDVMRSIHLLQRYEIRFGALAVITRASIGHADDIFRFFVDQGIKQFELLPCTDLPGEREEDSLTIKPEEYASFMLESLDLWFAEDDPTTRIRFLESALQGILGVEPGLCSMSMDCCGAFPSIVPNGNVYFCDDYEGSEDMRIGNLLTTPLSMLLAEGTRHAEIRSQVHAVKQRCRDTCEWYPACGGGCPRHNRSGPYEQFGQQNYYCAAYRRILPQLLARSHEIMDATLAQATAYQ